MIDLIRKLPAGARVLDLGARSGSFDALRADIQVVRLDLGIRDERSGSYVSGDGARMPFAAQSFDAVIANHSLEQCVALEETLRDIGRVIRPGGSLFVSVPHAGTVNDRIYRWLGRGGGHVNPFRSAPDVASLIERLTGLPHRATTPLYSSLCFLNAHNFTARAPRRIAVFANGNERFLAMFMWTLRLLDGRFGSRLSHYGWSFYFGGYTPPEPRENWINVCVRCGSGHSEIFLKKKGAIPPLPRTFDWYNCPLCGGLNLLTHEE